MRTAGAPEPLSQDTLRRAPSHSSRAARVGVHAARRRPPWAAPLAAVVVVVLAVASWQLLRLLPGGPSAPSAADTAVADGTAGQVGVTSQVSIDDAGAVHVVETLTFPSARTRLDLAVPRRGGVGEQLRPVLGSVVLRAPGPLRDVGPLDVGDQTTLRLDAPATRVVVEYDASGVVARSGDASNPERALALVTPLVVLEAGGLPSTVHVRSVKVLNVGCLHRGELSGCGTRTRGGWTVETSGGEGGEPSDVFAQVNLAVP
ncbi:hypothetical protein ACT8ZV_07880 [Nocardioides sp. MAHUQ-72]|uniref:hypothetical protein n=1 Tax=unclassified Nocardioides TaxID=2615069 RepID=UPI0036065BAE